MNREDSDQIRTLRRVPRRRQRHNSDGQNQANSCPDNLIPICKEDRVLSSLSLDEVDTHTTSISDDDT